MNVGRRRIWAVLAAVSLAVVRAHAGEVVDQGAQAHGSIAVAAAADLKFALDEIVAAFSDERHGVMVSVTYGSSGSFFAQLARGAPFDVFLSADAEYARRLIDAGHALDPAFPYAVGRLALWALRSTGLDVEGSGIAVLGDPRVRRVAIANPRHAPYGRAAEAALRSLGFYERVADKIVIGEDVAQAAQFVQSGAAEVGLVALSLASGPKLRAQGVYWRVPEGAHPRLEQAGVIMRTTLNANAARAFRDFVVGSHGRAVLERYGFGLPSR